MPFSASQHSAADAASPYTIRPLRENERALLEDFLYEAIFIPKGVAPPDRAIIRQPDLQVYVRDFGASEHDFCLAAELEGRPVGAVWARIMRDYGHLDEATPSLAIALYKAYRGRGIGTALLRRMLALLRAAGYERVSLSVQKANPAAALYARLGFEQVRENAEDLLLVRHLSGDV